MPSLEPATLPRSRHVACFEVLGRVVASDIPIANVRSASGEGDISIRVRQADTPLAPPPSMPYDYQSIETKAGIRYMARNVGTFNISRDGREIDYTMLHEAAEHDFQYLLTGPILSLALQLQGEILLHSLALQLGNRSVAIAGPHAAGKSTLAAYFQSRGQDLLTDDVLPLRQTDLGFLARQSVPWIKLGPESLKVIGESADDYPLVRTDAAKRRFPRFSSTESSVEYPLTHVYILAPQNSYTPISFRNLAGADGALAIFRNMYGADSLTGKRARSAFAAAADIAEVVAVREISYYRTFENLEAIRTAILQDTGEVSSGVD